MSRRAQIVGLVGACLLVAGCGGGGGSSTSGGSGSSSGSGSADKGVRIPGTPATQGGLTTYSGKGFQLSVPGAWKPFQTTSALGLVSVGWSTPATGNFGILTTTDPHPVAFATAVATETHVARTAYHATKLSIVNAQVPGAREAKLFTYSGPHGAGSYSNEPQQDADLIVSTSAGPMIEVQVISHGSGNPDPIAVINSFRLAQ